VAIPLLEQAVQDAQQYRSRQIQSCFCTHLEKAYGAQGRIAEAREWICQGLALATTIAHPWGIGLAQRALGWLALSSGAYAEAEQALRFALSLDPKLQAAYYNLGLVLAAEKRPEEAKESFRRARQLGPDNPFGQAALERLRAMGDRK
jgi:tetratricopeptide (TPR) repeat protein